MEKAINFNLSKNSKSQHIGLILKQSIIFALKTKQNKKINSEFPLSMTIVKQFFCKISLVSLYEKSPNLNI